MNTLCISTSLTSTELAAWVQAIGTILAVLAAAGIAVYQSKKQHQSSLATLKEERRHARLEQAETLLELCRNCTKAANYFTEQMNDRESVYKIAKKETYFDFGELNTLVNATTNIPLYSLPSILLTHAMVLGATVRQVKQIVDMAIELHRKLDSAQFEKIFRTLGEMAKSLELTCGDIEEAVEHVREGA